MGENKTQEEWDLIIKDLSVTGEFRHYERRLEGAIQSLTVELESGQQHLKEIEAQLQNAIEQENMFYSSIGKQWKKESGELG